MQDIKGRAVSPTLFSLLPAIVLVIVPTTGKYFRIVHGPVEGPNNRTFLLVFFVVFWVLFYSVAVLRSKKPKAQSTLRDLIRSTILDGLLGAIVGYVASLSAYVTLVLPSNRLGSALADRSDVIDLFLALLMGNYCWLLGGMCFIMYRIIRDVI